MPWRLKLLGLQPQLQVGLLGHLEQCFADQSSCKNVRGILQLCKNLCHNLYTKVQRWTDGRNSALPALHLTYDGTCILLFGGETSVVGKAYGSLVQRVAWCKSSPLLGRLSSHTPRLLWLLVYMFQFCWPWY